MFTLLCTCDCAGVDANDGAFFDALDRFDTFPSVLGRGGDDSYHLLVAYGLGAAEVGRGVYVGSYVVAGNCISEGLFGYFIECRAAGVGWAHC